MNNKGNSFIIILPAIAAGLLFIFLFAFLRINIFISLIVSIVIFIIFTIVLSMPSKKKESKITASLNNDVKANLELSKTYLRKLTQFTVKIEDKKLVEELKAIISDFDKIIKIVSENPIKYKRANKYLNYYPDSTIKILEQYDKIENDRLKGAEAVNFMKNVSSLFSQIKDAYDVGLNDLYSDDILDSSAELKVLESDLNSQLGSFKSDFNL
ncbi:MAG: 5-bromo-4-chloroindolyl phosphate hydrolysis family protein [Oscillospiraceae bacterium]|nr:5-bromo-4-chloroindolyl phosphate hydrolysis family protein [Oscillospiraceae bacterium]